MAGFWSLMKSAIGLFTKGVLLGLGFSLAMGATYLFIWQQMFRRADVQLSRAMSTMRAANREDLKSLVFSGVTEIKNEGAETIVGSIKNTGPRPLGNVSIQANFFLRGKFVDMHSTSLSGTIEPGDSQYFKILCGCKDGKAAEHDTYEVVAVSQF